MSLPAHIASRTRGFCGIGVSHGKHLANFGTLLRSAHLLGASFVFTVGARFRRQTSDTQKAWRHMPVFEYLTTDDLHAHLPHSAPLIGIELDPRAEPLENFEHPTRAVYLLGAEDHGLSPAERARCHRIVQLPGAYSLNVAAAGTVVLYDRHAKACAKVASQELSCMTGRGDDAPSARGK